MRGGGGGVLTEREATFKTVAFSRSAGSDLWTFWLRECDFRVCVLFFFSFFILGCLSAACLCQPCRDRLQPAGPCGTHLTGEQRRLSVCTAAHESAEGREARPGKQASRQAGGETGRRGGRRRRRKQTERQSSWADRGKKTDWRIFFSPGKKAEMQTDTSSLLYLNFYFFSSARPAFLLPKPSVSLFLFFSPLSCFFHCSELVKNVLLNLSELRKPPPFFFFFPPTNAFSVSPHLLSICPRLF